jgi:hypothetical protein
MDGTERGVAKEVVLMFYRIIATALFFGVIYLATLIGLIQTA